MGFIALFVFAFGKPPRRSTRFRNRTGAAGGTIAGNSGNLVAHAPEVHMRESTHRDRGDAILLGDAKAGGEDTSAFEYAARTPPALLTAPSRHIDAAHAFAAFVVDEKLSSVPGNPKMKLTARASGMLRGDPCLGAFCVCRSRRTLGQAKGLMAPPRSVVDAALFQSPSTKLHGRARRNAMPAGIGTRRRAGRHHFQVPSLARPRDHGR